jgi:putative flippase GtrA
MVAGSDAAGPRPFTPSVLKARRAGRAVLDRLGAAKLALLRAVPQRFHAITDEMAKFGTIGLINLGVNFAVFNFLLVAVSGSQVKAKAVATIVATTCAYFLNRHWTYRHRPKSTLKREYSLFFLFNAVGLVIETGIVALAKYGFDETSLVVLNICTFVGIALGTVFRFWAYRTHVFKESPVSAEAAPATIALAEPTVVQGGLPATVELRDEELRDELVQLELDELLTRDEMVADGTDPGPRH